MLHRSIVALLLLAAAPLAAQDFPARPIRILVPYAAGGAPDTLARMVALRLGESFGQQVIVENRPGAGGLTASVAVAKAPADGHTLLTADVGQLAINPFLFANLPYDPVRDFAPVSLVALSAMFLAVHPSTRIDSLQSLIREAKSAPGKLSYGSAGIGSIHHIGMESFKAHHGLDVIHVPYKGSGQSVPAFVAGEVSMTLAALPALGAHIKAGKGRLIAVFGATRSPQAPEVPAVGESIEGFDFTAEIGMLAPAGTPAPIVARLSTEIARAIRHPDNQARLAALGADAVGSTPEAYAEAIRRNLPRYAKAVKVSGAKAD